MGFLLSSTVLSLTKPSTPVVLNINKRVRSVTIRGKSDNLDRIFVQGKVSTGATPTSATTSENAIGFVDADGEWSWTQNDGNMGMADTQHTKDIFLTPKTKTQVAIIVFEPIE